MIKYRTLFWNLMCFPKCFSYTKQLILLINTIINNILIYYYIFILFLTSPSQDLFNVCTIIFSCKWDFIIINMKVMIYYWFHFSKYIRPLRVLRKVDINCVYSISMNQLRQKQCCILYFTISVLITILLCFMVWTPINAALLTYK